MTAKTGSSFGRYDGRNSIFQPKEAISAESSLSAVLTVSAERKMFLSVSAEREKYPFGRSLVPSVINKSICILMNWQPIVQGVPWLVSQVGHPFFRTYIDAASCPFTWWTGNVVGLIFWKKFLKFLILSGLGPSTSSGCFSGSAPFSASSSSCYQWVFNFLAWKPLHMVNLTSKMYFLGQVYHLKWFSGQKIEYPPRTWTCICCKPC